jgi:hypothetical protein
LSGELQDEGLLWQGQGVVVASGQEDEVSSGFFSAQDLYFYRKNKKYIVIEISSQPYLKVDFSILSSHQYPSPKGSIEIEKFVET